MPKVASQTKANPKPGKFDILYVKKLRSSKTRLSLQTDNKKTSVIARMSTIMKSSLNLMKHQPFASKKPSHASISESFNPPLNIFFTLVYILPQYAGYKHTKTLFQKVDCPRLARWRPFSRNSLYTK